MASVLHPWLVESLLAEASMALLWHMHGLQSQTGSKALDVRDCIDNEGRLESVTIESGQRGWAVQVEKSEKQVSGDWYLKLSDGRYSIRAWVRDDLRKSWEHETGEAFSDVVPGTLLELKHVRFRVLVQDKPTTDGRTRCNLMPLLLLYGFRIVGCQGESIFGDPKDLRQDCHWVAMHRTLTWWMSRKQEPLSANQAQDFMRFQKGYVADNGDTLSDAYIRRLREYLERPEKDDPNAGVMLDFARSVPLVDGAVKFGMSQKLGTPTTIPISSGQRCERPMVRSQAPIIERENWPTSTKSQAEKIPQTRDQRRPEEIHKDTARGIGGKPQPPTFELLSSPGSAFMGQQQTNSMVKTELSSRRWSRRDGFISKDQRELLQVSDEGSWIPAPPGGSDPKASLPLKILNELASDKRPAAEKERSATRQPRLAVVEKIIQEEAPKEPASQVTVYASEWSESPEPEARQMPPDTDDEGDDRVAEGRPEPKDTEAVSNLLSINDFIKRKLPCMSGDQHESSAAGEDEPTGSSNADSEIDSPASSAAPTFPRLHAHVPQEILAQPRVYPLDSPQSSSPVREPETPTVQVPATAPSPAYGLVPDTAFRPETLPLMPNTAKSNISRPRKRRSSEAESGTETDVSPRPRKRLSPEPTIENRQCSPELDSTRKQELEARPRPRKRRSGELDPSEADDGAHAETPEDPLQSIKRARAAFMAEQCALRVISDTAARKEDQPAPSIEADGVVNDHNEPVTTETTRAIAAARTPSKTAPQPPLHLTNTAVPTSLSTPKLITIPITTNMECTPSEASTTTAPQALPSSPAIAQSQSPSSTLYTTFQAAYPRYAGSPAHFRALVRRAAQLLADGELKRYALDDFVLRHATEYAVSAHAALAAGTDVEPYERFWSRVDTLVATRGVLTVGTMGELLEVGTARKTSGHGGHGGKGEKKRRREPGGVQAIFGAFAKKAAS